MKLLGAIGIVCAVLLCAPAGAADRIVVGSKIFTEGYVLGELAAQTLEASHPPVPVVRKLGMGSTGILFESLHTGAIDVYPDYTGTLAAAILKQPQLRSVAEIRTALAKMGIVISQPLGFDNTYALAVPEAFAQQQHLRTIADLARLRHSLRAGFSYEFMDRQDGYPGLEERYHLGLDPAHVNRMEHALTYQAIAQGAVDVIDVYSTDANIRKFRLRLLTDNLNYFPSYQAVWVAGSGFVAQYPAQWRALRRWEGRISASTMQDLNAQVDIDRRSVAQVAAGLRGSSAPRQDLISQIGRRTLEHLWLVGVSLAFSILIGIPLGILAVRRRRLGHLILTFSAVTQTIPSLALLCFLIPVFGVGTRPALAALCLYSLLPVVLATFSGIRSIDPRHLENARAFGLTSGQILTRIILPLASPALLTGIRTATIISIGTATLAALVGAGGYGVPIVSGLSLNDVPTILTGAIPAALMAWAAHAAFNLLGRFVIPAGLQRTP
ncbi:MAG TPA: glycine betaine ABC transporter substrate-binding protein [Steroidobacteraceae bacterium]|nr:glycine betaine ABC transporter substrate-binding protein [Steroidobacteraceae bacterium]